MTIALAEDNNDKQYIPHVYKEGSRQHIISYLSYKGDGYLKCSEDNCEMNRDYDENKGDDINWTFQMK